MQVIRLGQPAAIERLRVEAGEAREKIGGTGEGGAGDPLQRIRETQPFRRRVEQQDSPPLFTAEARSSQRGGGELLFGRLVFL